MYYLYSSKFTLFFTICAFFATLVSCQKTGELGLNEDDPDMGTVITDTFTVNSSSVLLDSLPTAGSGSLLIGHLEDPELGALNASSFFKLSPPSSISLPDGAVLDSANFVMNYNGYYYGDTSSAQTLSVHQLQEKIAYKAIPGYIDPEEQNVFSGTSTFYNRSAFRYSSQPITQKTFKPRPLSKDSIALKIPPLLASELFAYIKNSSTEVASAENFEEYFKGLMISSSGGNSIIGYKDSVAFKLYYSYTNTNGLRSKAEISFPLYDRTYQFNKIIADRTGSKIETLGSLQKMVSAEESDNKTFIQGGIGIVTRLSFPALSYLAADNTISINKAELIIEVPEGYDKPFKRPSELVFLLANKNNKPTQLYTESYTNTSSLKLIEAQDIDERSYYSFPLTEYVSNYAKKYSQTPLLLSMPVSQMLNSVNRLVVGSQTNSKAQIKLRITYTKNQR